MITSSQAFVVSIKLLDRTDTVFFPKRTACSDLKWVAGAISECFRDFPQCTKVAIEVERSRIVEEKTEIADGDYNDFSA